MKIRPLQDRIVVKRVEEEQKTSGGIIIPDTAKEKPEKKAPCRPCPMEAGCTEGGPRGEHRMAKVGAKTMLPPRGGFESPL